MQKNNYNRIAKIYDSLAQLIFGAILIKARLAFIKKLPKEGSLLFIGGGSGKVLSEIIQIRPKLRITYLDQSSKMIALSQQAVQGKEHRVTFIMGDENTLLDIQKFDSIISFFLFDLYQKEGQQSLFNRLNALLKLNGTWLFVDFCKPKNLKQKCLEIMMFFFFRIFTNIESKKLVNLQYLFENSQFTLQTKRHYKNEFIESMVFHKIRNDFC